MRETTRGAATLLAFLAGGKMVAKHRHEGQQHPHDAVGKGWWKTEDEGCRPVAERRIHRPNQRDHAHGEVASEDEVSTFHRVGAMFRLTAAWVKSAGVWVGPRMCSRADQGTIRSGVRGDPSAWHPGRWKAKTSSIQSLSSATQPSVQSPDSSPPPPPWTCR